MSKSVTKLTAAGTAFLLNVIAFFYPSVSSFSLSSFTFLPLLPLYFPIDSLHAVIRCFYHPYRTARLLKGTTLDQLSLTLDLSHWHVVGERNDVNCPEERALIQQLAPRVLHVHARIGGAQRPQVGLLDFELK